MPTNAQQNTGSRWRKWDLHVHSHASYGGTVELFSESLKNAEADVIGINDYFTTSGYRDVVKAGGAPGKVLFPVVEFRMNNILHTRAGNPVKLNFHIIFDNDENLQERIVTWLNSLDCRLQHGAKEKLGSVDLEALREKISFDFFEVIKSLREQEILSKHALVWLPYDEYGGIGEIDPENDQFLKTSLIAEADFLGSSNRQQIDFFLWKNSKHNAENISKWLDGRKIACIKGSDAHKVTYPFGRLMDEKSEPIEKYCWIKADPTFEGLRQVSFEPEYRVCIGKSCPATPLHYLKKVTFTFPEDTTISDHKFCFIGNQEMNFSPNLNCLIGGRGTGKSMALNLLAKKLASGKPVPDIFRSIVVPDGKDVDECISVDGAADLAYIEFLGQNEIERFAVDHTAFTKAIFQRIAKLDHDRKLETLGQNLRDAIKDANNQIVRISSLAGKRAELDNLRKNLNADMSIISSISSEEYKKITDAIDVSTKGLRRIETSRARFNAVREQVNEILEEHDEKVVAESNQYEIAYMGLIEALKASVSDTPDFSKIIEEETALRKDLDSRKRELSEFLETRNLSKEDLGDIAGAQERIVKRQEEIAEIEKGMNALSDHITRFDDGHLKTAKDTYTEEIVRQLAPVSTELQSLPGEVKPIVLTYAYDEGAARTFLLDEFQKLFGKVRADYLEAYLLKEDPRTIVNVKQLINAIQGSDKTLNKTQQQLVDIFKVEDNFAIFRLLVAKVFADLDKFLLVKVTYDGRPLEDSSFGQRCTAALVILLLLGNDPIIIDEPEAHLDSALIANYLVEALKKRKQSRQIIFATHNANFVINGDAELIHILDMDASGATCIRSTTIENLEYRRELLQLEGGVEAFERRGEKYAIAQATMN